MKRTLDMIGAANPIHVEFGLQSYLDQNANIDWGSQSTAENGASQLAIFAV